MKSNPFWRRGAVMLALTSVLLFPLARAAVKTEAGLIEEVTPDSAGVRAFKGIPFAAPPVGEWRWKAPQPVRPRSGVRGATEFGPRPMQARLYDDMIFRDAGPSEDCLYLNVWTPDVTGGKRLPVMFWIYGGGYQAGASSEPRQDGSVLARKGVVVVSCNYRLGVFGFLAHPELAAESPTHASGNYGLMDQIAALRWVRKNIAAFGGDPDNVTIFGESAGSSSVCALMASEQAHGLFQKAIGESGALLHAATESGEKRSRATAEERGKRLVAFAGARSIAELRAKPAAEVLQLAQDSKENFSSIVDGAVLNDDVTATFAAGRQNDVPLLAGWNADEVRVYDTFGSKRPTAASYAAKVREQQGARADTFLRYYPGATDAEALRSAGDFADDVATNFGMWKWMESAMQTGHSPVYRYVFDRTVPIARGRVINGAPATAADVGAVHASEIVYVFGALDSVPGVTWDTADRKLSDEMMTYWSNFARTGNPAGGGLPDWPRYESAGNFRVLHLDTKISVAPDEHRDRFQFLDVGGVTFEH